MGVPPGSTDKAFEIIKENAELVGFLKSVKDKIYVDLGAALPLPAQPPDTGDGSSKEEERSPNLCQFFLRPRPTA